MKPGPKPRQRTAEEIAAKKAAKAAYDREYRAKNAEKIRVAKKVWGQTEVKKAGDKRWAEQNRERSNEIKRAWKERNPEHAKAYYEANAEKIRARERTRAAENSELNRARAHAWAEANPERAKATFRRIYERRKSDYVLRARARRQHIDERATPKWADKDAIAAIYKKATELGMHVDHIIPLRGKLVSGLHVETNLQLLTPQENMKKGNRYAG